MIEDNNKKDTPAALFGLFSDELNSRILQFRQEALRLGYLRDSETMTSAHEH